jgi:DNA-binding transcriptional ArsR family regulator
MPKTEDHEDQPVNHQPDIARAAALLADPSRAHILKALSDGRALTATLLAAEAGVRAQTASAHLAKLVESRLITTERRGRCRYYKLAGPEVSFAMEALAVIAPPLPVKTLRESNVAGALRRSRTCYDHLAGRLGVELLKSLVESGALQGHDGTHDPARAQRDRPGGYGHDVSYALTPGGCDVMTKLGIDLGDLPARRPMLRYCVDWSEGRHHLAGALGAAIAERLFELDWLRHGNAPRVVHLTDRGRSSLDGMFGLVLEV